MSAPNPFRKMPLKQMKTLIESTYATVLVLDAALRDVPNLPKAPYQNALGMWQAQLNVMVQNYEKRTNAEKTERMMQAVAKAVMPEVSHGQE